MTAAKQAIKVLLDYYFTGADTGPEWFGDEDVPGPDFITLVKAAGVELGLDTADPFGLGR
jgi:hypothetical protein